MHQCLCTRLFLHVDDEEVHQEPHKKETKVTVSLAARNTDYALLHATVGWTQVFHATKVLTRKNTMHEIERQCLISIAQSPSLYPYIICKFSYGMCSSTLSVG
jgi:hypothetical protein